MSRKPTLEIRQQLSLSRSQANDRRILCAHSTRADSGALHPLKRSGSDVDAAQSGAPRRHLRRSRNADARRFADNPRCRPTIWSFWRCLTPRMNCVRPRSSTQFIRWLACVTLISTFVRFGIDLRGHYFFVSMPRGMNRPSSITPLRTV